jgi:hypothetical protein
METYCTDEDEQERDKTLNLITHLQVQHACESDTHARIPALKNALKAQGETPQPGESHLHGVILIVKERIWVVWEKVKGLTPPLSFQWQPTKCYMAA